MGMQTNTQTKTINNIEVEVVTGSALIRPGAIRTIPTLSHRRSSVTKFLNRLLEERPEMSNTIYALVTYSTQKWARDARAGMGLDELKTKNVEESLRDATLLMDIIHERSDIRARIEDARMVRLSESDCILDTITEAVDWIAETPVIGEQLSHAIKAVHFMDYEAELTPPDFRKHYKPAVLYIHDCYGEQIRNQVGSMSSSRWLYDGDSQSDAYHNTVLLIKIYGLLTHRYARRCERCFRSEQSIQKDMDGLILLRTFEDAMEALRTYRNDGETLYQIIRGLAAGKTDVEIKQELSLSSRSFSEKKPFAINLLSFVLWGYSTLEIVDGIATYHLTRREIQALERKIGEEN